MPPQTYEHMARQAGTLVTKVHPVDASQRDRPVLSSIGGKRLIFRDRLSNCVYVGDRIDFLSPANVEHGGIVVGDLAGTFKVLVDGFAVLAYVETKYVLRLNGCNIVDLIA